MECTILALHAERPKGLDNMVLVPIGRPPIAKEKFTGTVKELVDRIEEIHEALKSKGISHDIHPAFIVGKKGRGFDKAKREFLLNRQWIG